MNNNVFCVSIDSLTEVNRMYVYMNNASFATHGIWVWMLRLALQGSFIIKMYREWRQWPVKAVGVHPRLCIFFFFSFFSSFSPGGQSIYLLSFCLIRDDMVKWILFTSDGWILAGPWCFIFGDASILLPWKDCPISFHEPPPRNRAFFSIFIFKGWILFQMQSNKCMLCFFLQD